MEDSSVWTFMLAVGVAAMALLWTGIASVTALLNPVRRRLKALREDTHQALVTGSAVHQRSSRLWRFFEPSKETERAGVQLRLVQAGFRSPAALGVLYSAKLACAAAMPVVVLAGLKYAPDVHLPSFAAVGVGLVAFFIGSLLPDIYLRQRFKQRKERMMDGLPDALDLLVTCTEAGLGLNAALERVVEQLPGSHPDLAVELGQVNAEMRAGIDRGAALKNLGERTGLEEINGLVSLITHSTRLGTGIAGTLRIYAEDFRDRRMQQAEEFAATVGTKLIFPLLLCLWPSFFIVAVGPSILNLGKVFGGE